MSRWPRRGRRLPADMPQALRAFVADDWQTWTLDGPDPALEGFADHDATEFYAGLADRPDLVADHRRQDAFTRWREARVAWLKDHGHEWIEFWVDTLSGEEFMAEETGRPHGW